MVVYWLALPRVEFVCSACVGFLQAYKVMQVVPKVVTLNCPYI